tara:strand:- start:155 stop:382 length:228 start_codon:yes stop_codon:yes gene_type:complete
VEYFLIGFFFIWIPIVFFTTTIANSKDYNGLTWFIGGFLFGPIALISIAGMPDKKLKKYLRVITEILDEMSSEQP